jgi:peptidoglycan/LPS O-acetylase OafA/YrhL
MIGVMLYIKPDFFSKNSVYISLLLCVGIVLLHYFIPDLRLKVIDKNDVDYFEQLNLLLPLLLVPFISYNLKVKSDKKDRQYGNLSYTVYLVHWLLIIPYNHFFSHLGLTQRLPFALLYILATLVVSNYILKYFELPLQKKMRTFL